MWVTVVCVLWSASHGRNAAKPGMNFPAYCEFARRCPPSSLPSVGYYTSEGLVWPLFPLITWRLLLPYIASTGINITFILFVDNEKRLNSLNCFSMFSLEGNNLHFFPSFEGYILIIMKLQGIYTFSNEV